MHGNVMEFGLNVQSSDPWACFDGTLCAMWQGFPVSSVVQDLAR